MTIKAKKGGEFGANGEFYKGGQWLNTVEENPKSSTIGRQANKVKKIEVAPYVWQEVEASKVPYCIYTRLSGAVKFYESAFKLRDWKVDRSTANIGYFEYAGIDETKFNELCDLFDNGIYFFN